MGEGRQHTGLGVAKPLQPPHQLRLRRERIRIIQKDVEALVIADRCHAKFGTDSVLALAEGPRGARGETEHGEVGVGKHA